MAISSQQREQIQRALDQADHHPSSQWYLGIYDADSRILGLSTSEYSDAGKPVGRGYLYFRAPRYLSLPSGFGRHLRFHLGAWEDIEERYGPPEAEREELLVVVLESWNTAFYIVCEAVRFHQAEILPHLKAREERKNA